MLLITKVLGQDYPALTRCVHQLLSAFSAARNRHQQAEVNRQENPKALGQSLAESKHKLVQTACHGRVPESRARCRPLGAPGPARRLDRPSEKSAAIPLHGGERSRAPGDRCATASKPA
jgi:hypothetical protein